MGRKAKKNEDLEAYRHEAYKRKNAVPVGIASYDTAKQKPKKYEYDPHLDPVRKHAPLFMMSYKTIFEWCSISVSNGVGPQLVWTGTAEHTSFEVPTVSLHIHERIAPEG